MGVSARVTHETHVVQTGAASELVATSGAIKVNHVTDYAFAEGTGAGQVDRAWHDRRTLAASATEDLDFAGVLVDIFGAGASFVKIRSITLKAMPGNTNNVVFGAAAANAWAGLLNAAGTITLPPGGEVTATAGAGAAGFPVVAGTGDKLKVLNGGAGTPVDYEIIIVGTSV